MQPGPHLRRRTVRVALGGLVALAAACSGTTGRHVESAAPSTVAEEELTTTSAAPDCAQILPPAAQAGQLLMTMATAPTLATDVVSSGRVAGFGLKGRQSSEVGDEITEAVADAVITPFVAGDEEGGTVQRLRAALGTLPSAAEMGEGTPADSASTIGPYAEGMVGLGFNMNFGPVADVGAGSELGSRVFGDDAAEVTEHVVAVVGAQQEAGLISVVKHWPGIGSGETDPHVALDALDPVTELRARDMTVFDAAFAAGAPAVMVAHATVEGLTGEDEPASLSREAITGELRGRQGFTGLVVTDALGMGAIVNHMTQDVAAERAIAAGADIALLSGPDVVEAAHRRLTDAITTGRIPNAQVVESVRRVLTLKGVTGQCLDLAGAFSELQQTVAAQLQDAQPGEADEPEA